MQSNPRFLTVEQVLDLHETTINLHGGSIGIKDLGLVEQCTYAPQHTWEGEYLYPSISHMTCAYWHSFTCGHCFVDGNKRIGLLTASVFAKINGYEMKMSQEFAEEISLRLAKGEFSKAELFEVVGEMIIPRIR